VSSQRTSRWRALVALLIPDRGRWIALGVLAGVAAALTLAGPLVLRRIVDDATAGTTAAAVARLAVVYLVIAMAAQATLVVISWWATTSAWRTTNELRIRMARHVLGLDHEFHRTHTPGELIQRVDGDVTSVSDFLGRVVPRALGAVLLLVGMVVVLTVIDVRLGLALVAYIAVALVVLVRGRDRAVDESEDEMGSYARLYGGIEERLVAAEDLRANGALGHVMWRFVEDSAGAMQSSERRERAFMRMWWTVQMAVMLGSAASLVASAVAVANGWMTLGTAFLLLQYVLLVSRPLENLVEELETVQKATGAMVRVLDLLDRRPGVVDRGTTSPPAGPLGVRFVDVSFDYGDGAPVLSHVDLELRPGRRLGVVGRTGSGKTTASRLVLRLVEATSGRVELGGVPIADIPLAELRHRVASIPQEVELFTGSVRDNVTLFDDGPSDAEVEAALRAVGLDALVDGGIDRELGAGGTGMSAGEAQLLSLARVWVRHPDLVVLDEATARIDPATEARLAAAVDRLTAGRTTIVIAHRLSTLHRVDDVVVLDHGCVVEHGTRETLAADPGSRFHRLLALEAAQRVETLDELDELESLDAAGEVTS
jgi:ABC-type multidrug transport system fused ATPase/permease subunit